MTQSDMVVSYYICVRNFKEVNMSRLTKAEDIIELAMMFQNSYCGLCIYDIQEHFECSRRSAERMKALLFKGRKLFTY